VGSRLCSFLHSRSTRKTPLTRTLWIVKSTTRTLCFIGLNLGRLHPSVTKISRIYPDHSRSRQCFTKMAHLIRLEEKVTAQDLAEAFLQQVRKLRGVLSEIISHMDGMLAEDFWELLYKRVGVKRTMWTAYYLLTEGQTQRVNQVLGGYLHIVVNYNQDNWYNDLP